MDMMFFTDGHFGGVVHLKSFVFWRYFKVRLLAWQ